MNREDLRSRSAGYCSWNVSSADTAHLLRHNNAIDDAMSLMATKASEALFPDDEYVVLLPDHTQGTMARTIATTADPWVLSLGPVAAAGALENPSVNGTWDGIYHIEVVDSLGVWHRRQCRSFFIDTATYYVALDRPWTGGAGSGLSFRIHSPAFFVADDVTKVLDGSLWDGTRQFMVPVPEASFLYGGRADYRGEVKARPTSFARGRHYQIDAPNRAPQCAQSENAWVGPEPEGEFEYAFTICHGYRDAERGMPGEAQYYPQFESARSPISAKVSVTAHKAIVVTLPELEWQLNFNVAGTLRQGHSGRYLRLWRRRNTVTGGAHQTIERGSVWQFLKDIPAGVILFEDTGAIVPDYLVRMPDVAGYYGWIPHDHQDQRYELDLRVTRRPRALTSDFDAPRIEPEFIPVLLCYIGHFLCKLDNNPAGALSAMNEGDALIRTYRAQCGTPASVVPTEPWGTTPLPGRVGWYGRATSD